MDSFKKSEEQKIPDIDSFKSSITGETITIEDHKHALNVSNHFDMKTLQYYHNRFSFGKICIKTYGLDRWHYYSTSGLTWDAGLKYTRVTLDLLTEEDKFLFVEAGIRGAISLISHRHARANPISMISDITKKVNRCVRFYI